MTFDELKDKAHTLPLEPGVYLMQDHTGKVIYVGKAKVLRNRVSQYFVDSASHSFKTRKMVSCVDRFDVIVAASEFEALVLECSLIKRHMPKYNILLKDDKGYPYLRINLREEYPTLTISSRVYNDGAEYYGPFGGRHLTQQLIDAVRLVFRLPGCSRKFPRDIGKDRPCLNFHMNNCEGWCRPGQSPEKYRQVMEQVSLVLQGKYRQVSENLRKEMEHAAESLEFERAAALRDRLLAIENLGKKQLATAGTMAHTDVVGYYRSETRACFTVLHYVDGSLLDKHYELLTTAENEEDAVASLVKQFYLTNNYAPKEILLPCVMEDAQLFSDLLLKNLGKRVRIRTPQRGDGVKLVELAGKNAREELERVTSKEERAAGTVLALQNLLGMKNVPQRIESFDISHTMGVDIVASMVVFRDGRPLKGDYRRFKIEDLQNQDDYRSMEQVLRRRFLRLMDGDKGFSAMPDLLLIDGGTAHAHIACSVLREFDLEIPVYGMVKDNRHRTRALVTAEGEEISLQGQPSLFALIGRIQEETHRFAISYHRSLRNKHLRESQLDQISGIGPTRKRNLLRRFKSVSAIGRASLAELQEVLPTREAQNVYDFYHSEQGE